MRAQATTASSGVLLAGLPVPKVAWMRRTAAGVVGLAVGLALWGGRAWGGNQTTVPAQVRNAIVRDYPGWAFIPGRLPSGYHYASWTHSRVLKYGYVLVFLHGSVRNQVELQVQRRSCPAPPKWPAKGTLHVNGHALKWLQSDHGPIVWRCLTKQGRSFVIFGVSSGASRQKLAELVGYALPAH
jgi:hypothetical protein